MGSLIIESCCRPELAVVFLHGLCALIIQYVAEHSHWSAINKKKIKSFRCQQRWAHSCFFTSECESVWACVRALSCVVFMGWQLVREMSATVKHTSSLLLTRHYFLYVVNLFAFGLYVNVISVQSCVVAVRPSFHSSSSFR